MVQLRTPKWKTQIKSAVPAVAKHPRKNVIHESQRYHLINPFRFDSSDIKLCSLFVNSQKNTEAVVVERLPVKRLSDDEDRETSLYPSYDGGATALTLVRFYVLIRCGALDVRNRFI